MPNTTNAQVTDAVTQTNVKVLGEAPAQSMAMVYQVMATSVGASMQNATNYQDAMQKISIAIVSTATAKILAQAPTQ